MNIINGNKIADRIKEEITAEIEKDNLDITLGIIYAGENSASQIYVDKKIRWAEEVGIKTELFRMTNTTTAELLTLTNQLNSSEKITGYIVQLPLPQNVQTSEILSNISPLKDVDGLSPLSLGKLFHNEKATLVSATALSVMECIKEIQGDTLLLHSFLEGKRVLIINHSLLVGKPLSALLLNHNVTLSIAHKYTPKPQLDKLVRENDIVISATGKSGLITSDMVRDGQILIDVGINKSADGIGGDIDLSGMKDMNIWLTPVPNGVGPVTVAMLLKNTLKAKYSYRVS